MKKKKKNNNSIDLAAQSGAAMEVVSRYGSASKEHLVAYSGIDNENNKTLVRGLKKTAKSRINDEYASQNIKQQAGFAAEDKYTARQNAEKIIQGSKQRYSRTDDLGRVNDPLYDHVLLDSDGIEIPGTGEQMKFVGSNPKACLDKLESEKFQKYLDADAIITVPSDYYEEILKEADNKILSLEKQLSHVKETGNKELEQNISQRIEKVKKIKSNIKNSGISNEEAIYARLHPKLSTAKDIAKISHRAGLEQAKTGALIGGGISLIRNIVAVNKGEKDASKAALDFVKDTGTGAVTAYATAFAGSAIKASMQNAGNTTIRSISKTNAPAAIVTSTIEVTKTLTSFVRGEINGLQCLEDIGEKGTCNISSAMFAVIGQAAIPVPIVGAMVGSMIGYALSSTFYNMSINSLKEAKIAHQERLRIEKECQESIALIKQYRSEMNSYLNQYFKNYNSIFDYAFEDMDKALKSDDIDMFIGGANRITTSLGGEIQFTSREEFDSLMNSKQVFNL